MLLSLPEKVGLFAVGGKFLVQGSGSVFITRLLSPGNIARLSCNGSLAMLHLTLLNGQPLQTIHRNYQKASSLATT